MAVRKIAGKHSPAASAPRRAKSQSIPAPEPAAVPASVRDLPIYFQGKPQSSEFAAGAWAAMDMLAAPLPRPVDSDHEMTGLLAERFFVDVDRGGDHARGFVAALVELLVIGMHSDIPEPGDWHPLRQAFDYSLPDDAIGPVPGSRLFSFGGSDGLPVSLSPDMQMHAWLDALDRREQFHFDQFADVLRIAQPVSRETFDAMRRAQQAKSAASDGATSSAAAAAVEPAPSAFSARDHGYHRHTSDREDVLIVNPDVGPIDVLALARGLVNRAERVTAFATNAGGESEDMFDALHGQIEEIACLIDHAAGTLRERGDANG